MGSTVNLRIRSPRDFCAGAIFLFFGLGVLVIGRGYPMGTAQHMGSGYFPIVLGALLAILGAGTCIRSMVVAGDAIDPVGLRPLLLVLIAIGVFAAAVDSMGLAVATVLLTLIAAAASVESRWREVVVLTLALLGISVGVFVYGLGLPFKLSPF